MNSPGTPPTVVHDPAGQRFEMRLDGDDLAHVDYRLADGTMRLVHTEVPPRYNGRGLAGALVRAALVHARASGWRVVPQCSYVRAYMKRHADTQDLLAPGVTL